MTFQPKVLRGFVTKPELIDRIFYNPYIASPRRPKNMPHAAHQQADDWFRSKFGIAFRSQSIFASGDISVARSHAATGYVAAISPVSPSETTICWSPLISDLYGAYEGSGSQSITDILESGEYQFFAWTDEAALQVAVQSGNELMLHGKGFYLDFSLNA